MDLKDPKNQVLIFISIIFIVAIYGWYSVFFTNYGEKLDQQKRQYEKFRSELFAVKQEAKSLDALKEKFNKQNLRYEKIKLLLPEKKEDESLLAQMHVAAQLTNSTIISITPQETVQKDYYNANNYMVELESTYHDLGKFFAKVVNFPFIVTISDVELKQPEKEMNSETAGGQNRNTHTVSATFKLTSYNSNQGG